ncbi:HIR complex subunit [Talaromyces marneffei ATCC 18224]
MHAPSLTRSHSLENMLSTHNTPSYMTPTHGPPAPQASPPRSSGRNYDPIRSAFGDPAPPPPVSHQPPSSHMGTAMLSPQNHFSPPQHSMSPQRIYRASASPAISSIIDPPAPPVPVQQQLPPQQHSGYPNHTQGYPSYGSNAAPPAHHYGQSPSKQAPTLSQITNPSPPPPPPPQPPRFSTQQLPPQPPQSVAEQNQYPTPRQDQPSVASPPQPEKPAEKISLLQQPVAMEIDSEPAPVTAPAPVSAPIPAPDTTPASTAPAPAPTKPVKTAKKDKGTPTATPSSAPSPKPARAAKDAVPPPLPQGSGLITGALFGVDDSSSAASKTAPNIILHVPLSRDSNKIISFARLAEEKYGFAALHPRIAAQKERLARVAAASAALENNEKSGSARESAEEDLSVDIDRDSDPDGDISMGGVGLTAPEEPSDGKKKRRKKKIEEYDRDDPFVDDSELVWQEQAAASKDGFFVYSGPLIAEGEKVQVERADGTIKRGRGGRGRGGARTRGGHAHVPITSNVPVSAETGLPLRGPGSRGGNTARKPRTNKAKQQGDDKSDARTTGTSKSGTGRGGGSAGGSANASSKSGSKAPASTTAPAATAASTTSITGLAPAPAVSTSAPGPQLAPAPAQNGQVVP